MNYHDQCISVISVFVTLLIELIYHFDTSFVLAARLISHSCHYTTAYIACVYVYNIFQTGIQRHGI